MEINRIWSMPNKNTFNIKPIEELLLKYIKKLPKDAITIDPFANKNKFATVTNDLDTQYNTDYNLDATEFLSLFQDEGTERIGT